MAAMVDGSQASIAPQPQTPCRRSPRSGRRVARVNRAAGIWAAAAVAARKRRRSVTGTVVLALCRASRVALIVPATVAAGVEIPVEIGLRRANARCRAGRECVCVITGRISGAAIASLPGVPEARGAPYILYGSPNE